MSLPPYSHTRIFAAAAPGSGAKIHTTLMPGAAKITPQFAAGTLRVTCQFAADTTLSVVAHNGTTEKTGLLNEGATFLAGCLYKFGVDVTKKSRAAASGDEDDMTYDFVCGSNVAIDRFDVREIPEASS